MRAPTLFELLPRAHAEQLCKLAEEQGRVKKYLHAAANLVVPPIVGMGMGTLAGFGAGHLANKVYEKATGSGIPHAGVLSALPILGGGLGLAYNLAQARQMEAMRRALESPHNNSDRSVPRE
jgi:hypothetical protein